MTFTYRNNLSAIKAFLDSLDRYEQTLYFDNLNPATVEIPANHLHTALALMITAEPVDSYQMLRCLVDRMVAQEKTAYSEYAIWMVASGSVNTLFQSEVAAIVMTMRKIMKQEIVDLGINWLSSINSNNGIKTFMELYPSCSQACFFTSYGGNRLISSNEILVSTNSDLNLEIPIGDTQQDLTLISLEYQTLMFKKSDQVTYRQDYRDDLPTVFRSTVTIRPNVKILQIDRRVNLSAGAKYLADNMDCWHLNYGRDAMTAIKIPAPFFAFELEVFSFDSGTSWTIDNIKIIPPSLENL